MKKQMDNHAMQLYLNMVESAEWWKQVRERQDIAKMAKYLPVESSATIETQTVKIS